MLLSLMISDLLIIYYIASDKSYNYSLSSLDFIMTISVLIIFNIESLKLTLESISSLFKLSTFVIELFNFIFYVVSYVALSLSVFNCQTSKFNIKRF